VIIEIYIGFLDYKILNDRILQCLKVKLIVWTLSKWLLLISLKIKRLWGYLLRSKSLLLLSVLLHFILIGRRKSLILWIKRLSLKLKRRRWLLLLSIANYTIIKSLRLTITCIVSLWRLSSCLLRLMLMSYILWI
jgi:hypothetical protein